MLLSLVFCVCWGLVLILLQKLYYSDIRFNCCVVCLIHAFASCRGCEMVWYIEQSLKLDQFGSDLTESQYCVLSLSTGYFLYSTIMDVYNNVEFFLCRAPYSLHFDTYDINNYSKVRTRTYRFDMVL